MGLQQTPSHSDLPDVPAAVDPDLSHPRPGTSAHHTTHETGGTDEVAGLGGGGGPHAATHASGGTDQLSHDVISEVSPNDHHNQAHGAADHDDTTRRLWLPSRGLTSTDGTSTSVDRGILPNANSSKNLPDAATSGVTWIPIAIPDNCIAGSTLALIPIWASSASVAGTPAVRWSADALILSAGVDQTAAGTTTTWTGNAAARTANLTVIDDQTQILASVNPNDILRLNFRRIGADAADTLNGATVDLYGVFLIYAAVQ